MAILGAGGGLSTAIASIQRGRTQLDADGTEDVTINSVDLTKSIVNTSCQSGWSLSKKTNYESVWWSGGGISAGCRLSSTTNLEIKGGEPSWSSSSSASNSQTGLYICWEVIEYE